QRDAARNPATALAVTGVHSALRHGGEAHRAAKATARQARAVLDLDHGQLPIQTLAASARTATTARRLAAERFPAAGRTRAARLGTKPARFGAEAAGLAPGTRCAVARFEVPLWTIAGAALARFEIALL